MLTKQTIRKYVDELGGASLIGVHRKTPSQIQGLRGVAYAHTSKARMGDGIKMPLCFLWQILSDISKPANKNCHIAKSPG